ncbi:MAG: CoA ester lyase [Burkholderiaceae bacterium]
MTAAPRSWLFVPGNRPERFDKAVATGADAVILDLEDAVVPAARAAAAVAVRDWLSARAATDVGATQIWVRVPSATDCPAEVRALGDCASLTGFVLPKVESAADLAGWNQPLMAQIETALGVLRAEQICADGGEHLLAVALGPEDLSVSLGCRPDEAGMRASCERVLLAARAFGRHVYACPGTISAFRDLEEWRTILLAGKAIGSDGMLCIHPAQVGVVHEVFSPAPAQIDEAASVVAAYEAAAAAGHGAVQLDGRMIDAPVVERARRLLDRADRFGLR